MLPCTPPPQYPASVLGLVCVTAEALPSLSASLSAPPRQAAANPLSCGATVSEQTLLAVIRVESGGRRLAYFVNGLKEQPPPVDSDASAVAAADGWIAKGYSVDLGLMQVNSRNLAALGYTVAQMFDPCTNIRAGASILTADYLSAQATRADPQAALMAALSAYNTGTFDRGFYNGYVAKYYGPPAISAAPAAIVTAALTAPSRVSPPNPYTADPTIYTRQEDTHG